MSFIFFKFVDEPSREVDGILAEGRNWVSRLETASKEAHQEATQIDKRIHRLETERDALKAKGDEGSAVATNFKKLLTAK